MSNALTPQNLNATAVSIDLDQIQGDVGFAEACRAIPFLSDQGLCRIQGALLRKKIAHRITTTRTVQERLSLPRSEVRQRHRRTDRKSTPSR
jgi:hypothetical protein